jgi:hypothetical protein
MRILIAILFVGLSNLTFAQPSWILNLNEFNNRTVNEWAEYETTLRYRDIVKMKGITTFFGIKGDARGGGVVVVMTDPNVSGRDGLIYGAYSDENKPNTNHAKSFNSPIIDFSFYWDGTSHNISSTRFRRRALLVEDNTGSSTEAIPFKSWSLVKMSIKVTVITFGNSGISDFEYALPGFYADAINQGYITHNDFDAIYNNANTVTWKNSANSTARPVMALESGGELEIRNNQTQSQFEDVGAEDVILEVWGKMLSHDAGTSVPAIPSVYDYGLWVGGDMVSENFIMHPKSGWADHVFINQYELPELNEIENFVKENGYLPNVPSKKEVLEIGYTQHNINVRLLEYVEQLTLHKIRQSHSIEDSRALLSEQKKKIDKLLAHLDASQ